jgi:hypothetical protein
MSALPPKADIADSDWHVRFVPKADKVHCIKIVCYSITSSAVASSVGGTVSPSALAVLRLITSSNLVGCAPGFFEMILWSSAWGVYREDHYRRCADTGVGH